MNFIYQSAPVRVVFARGAIKRAGAEVSGLGARALVLTTAEQGSDGERLKAELGTKAVALYCGAKMHVPAEVVDEAVAVASDAQADCTIALGGGSTIGLAKALALRLKLPCMAVPTTYAGSEMTPIWGLTEGGRKTTGREASVQPKVVLYDPDLSAGLPVAASVSSGMNAIAHCVEALYAHDSNPIGTLMAEEGIRALAASLPKIRKDPQDIEARSLALYGAWLGGTVLGMTSMGLHHKLCHVLGGTLNLPHAETHTAVLPHAAAYNYGAATDAMRRVAAVLGTDYAPAGLFDLARSLGAEMALRSFGMVEEAVDGIVEQAVQQSYPNPRPLEAGGLRELLLEALRGNRPESARQ